MSDRLIVKKWCFGCLIAVGFSGLGGIEDATAQMSSTNCMVMGGGLISCNTMDMSPQSYGDGGAQLGQGIGRLIASIGEKSFKKKVGKMLADGDCQGAARYAYEKGRIELGASIADACQGARQPVKPAAVSRENPILIEPGAIEGVLIQVAQNAKTPMEIFDETTVSKVNAVGKQLILTALVDRKGATITENGRLKIVRDICTSSAPLLKAGATVRIDFYERSKSSARPFDSVVATGRECAL